jgi:hypothetical protein
VRHLNDGGTGSIQLAKQFHDFLGLIGMQVTSSLVGQKEFRFGHCSSHHADQLLLAAGELSSEQITFSDDVESV